VRGWWCGLVGGQGRGGWLSAGSQECPSAAPAPPTAAPKVLPSRLPHPVAAAGTVLEATREELASRPWRPSYRSWRVCPPASHRWQPERETRRTRHIRWTPEVSA
ncbi:hypothetical protein ACWGJX_46610, partial [Streptomyces sp. NPDC054775]